jgi:hypothetical protein
MKKTNITVAEYISSVIGFSGKSNAQIAADVGYGMERANFISMWRTGRAKIPLNKVALFAKSVGVDTTHMLRLVLKEYSPQTYEALEPFLTSALSEGEVAVVNVLRKEAGDLPIELSDSELVQLQSSAKAAAKRATSNMKIGRASSDKNFTSRGEVSPLRR